MSLNESGIHQPITQKFTTIEQSPEETARTGTANTPLKKYELVEKGSDGAHSPEAMPA